MKIFETRQIAEIDASTMACEPISEAGLMERASMVVADWIIARFAPGTMVAVVAGPGNNGGDALVVARLLALCSWPVDLYIPELGRTTSALYQLNLKKVETLQNISVKKITGNDPWVDLSDYDLIVDGLFGSGLKRPLAGFAAQVVQFINASPAQVVSIDIPSGLMGEESRNPMADNVVKANYTLSFQFPKLSFMFRENDDFVGKWEILPIGLDTATIAQTITPWFFTDDTVARSLLIERKKFAHKGHFGHSLLIAGSRGKMGAALLAARATLRAGAGLLTLHLPQSGVAIVQTALPEAMVSIDPNANYITDIPSTDPDSYPGYRAVGIGPGLGKSEATAATFFGLLKRCGAQLVFDADALNILAEHPDWLEFLQPNDILTPHPTEFERLTGKKAATDLERLQQAIAFAQRYRVIVVLKGAHTAVVSPDGETWFNSTGNPGMATAGSGDVLTGILLSLLSQGYPPKNAARLGVYLHGLSADLWVEENSVEALMAGDIADNLGKAFAHLKRKMFGKAEKNRQF